MSSIPPATTDPNSPQPAAPRPVETAPSAIMVEGPTLARAVGFIGLFLLVLGAVVIITTRAVGPRWVSEGYGFVFAGIGLALMLYHAVTDGEQEVRRMYGGLAAGLLILALATALIPGPFEAPSSSKTVGHYLLPWGVGAGFLALLFAVPFTRHETDDLLRNMTLNALLGVGAVLCGGVVIVGVLFNPDFLAGPGLALGVLGVGFVCAYLGQVETADGVGFSVAFALGAVGAATLFYAFGRTVFPTVLFDGPAVLRKANQALDYWKASGRGLVILLALGFAVLGAVGKFPLWLRGTLAAVGLITAGVFVAASSGTQLTTPPKPFLVPSGLILAAIGALYLTVALGACSDSQIVILTRRELSAYFFSPIGYLVIAGMAAAEWLAYLEFVGRLTAISSGRGGGQLPEPIVQIYFIALYPVFAMTVLVPMLTMRLVAEERRTGSIEVLFTAPVSEWVVVASKFLATWVVFILCWVPMGLFLVVLRVEGGSPFDYRPLLGFYLALSVTGGAFVAMGVFFSSLTKNQIIAAVLTFVPMLMFLACYFVGDRSVGLGQTMQLLMKKLSYLDLWTESLSGQMPVRDLLIWASLTVFWLFLSIKVLEARRWS
jgi:ABC-2 type transport system permease protein